MFSEHPDSIGWPSSGSMLWAEDYYFDNPYMIVYDHQSEFYQSGNFITNYLSVGRNDNKTNFLISYENSQQQGIVFSKSGYKRNNFRFNIDHAISPKLKVSASNLVSSTGLDDIYDLGSNYMWRTNWMWLRPDANINANNFSDGSPYRYTPSFYDGWPNFNFITTNPLYVQLRSDQGEKRIRYIGNFSAVSSPFDFFSISGGYGLDSQNGDYYEFLAKNTFYQSEYSLWPGSLERGFYKAFSQNAQLNLNFQKKLGQFNTGIKLSYLYQKEKWTNLFADGSDMAVKDIPDFSAIKKINKVDSGTGSIESKNYFGVLDIDFKEKFLGLFLYRYDGSSLFGEDDQWYPYFRASLAYRLTEELNIPGFQELKIRSAIGSAGVRPPYAARDETYEFNNGDLLKKTLGNSKLKPAKVKELEFGMNAIFLNRFKLELVYALTDAEDQLAEVTLPSIIGFETQWQNVGTIRSSALEASLGVLILNNKNISWKINLMAWKIRQVVTKLDIPSFAAPGGRYIAEGSAYGSLWGNVFLRSLDDMEQQIKNSTYYSYRDISDYELNSDGYVIEAGTQGTQLEKPIFKLDSERHPVYTIIGDGNPDFNMTISNTFCWKGFEFYFMLDWQKGGDIQNGVRQNNIRLHRAEEIDQYGKPEGQKKVLNYYSIFANWSHETLFDEDKMNDYFVEDGSFFKVREISIYYQLPTQIWKNFANGIVSSVRLGIIGRNLYTFTNYTGIDPEVADTYDPTGLMGALYYYAYPNYSTFAGTIEIKF